LADEALGLGTERGELVRKVRTKLRLKEKEEIDTHRRGIEDALHQGNSIFKL
jgi:hypothetical protein